MATENADRRTSADRPRQPGDQRHSRSARRITERAARARLLTDREAQAWHYKAAGYTNGEIGRLLVADGDDPLDDSTFANILMISRAAGGRTACAGSAARRPQWIRSLLVPLL